MAFDIDMIKAYYNGLASKIDEARAVLGKPLTLTEKILYSLLLTESPVQAFGRG